MDSHLGLKALRTAVPYIRAYKGHTFVIKLGGGLCQPGPTLANLADQIAVLHQLGIKIVLVHGGGQQATALSQRLGMTPEIIAGRRVTNGDTLEVAKMTFAGTINADLLAAFRKTKAPAIGLSGIDAGLVTAHRRPVQSVVDPSTGKTQAVDFGFVGDVDVVNAKPLEYLLAGEYIPIVCSLAADSSGQIYNVNADTLAARIAVEIHAAKYFSVTTVDGVLDDVNDPHSLHSYLDVEEVESLIRSGRLGGGMLPKLAACMDALRGGVARAHIVNGAVPDTLLFEIFTNEGCGTLIVAERDRNRPADTGGDAENEAETMKP
jgi:acetylglutamate kinase